MEEYLQDILNVAIQNLVTGDDKQINFLDPQYMYDFLMGEVTAGFMEAPGQIRNSISSSKAGSAVINAGKAMELIQNALILDPRSEAYRLARKLKDGALVQSNTNVGELMIAYKEAGGDVSFMTRPAKDAKFIPAQYYEAATQKMQSQNVQSSLNPTGNTLPQTNTNADEGSGAQARRAAAERNMIKAVSVLTNLPAGLQAKVDAYAARQALYDYLNADESNKAAAYNKAMDQLRKSISTALATDGLDKWTRQALEGMLDNIDSEGEIGDNTNRKESKEKLEGLKSLDDIIDNPTILNGIEPKDFYEYLTRSGFKTQPLNKGRSRGMSFEDGGGFKVIWGGDRSIEYNPLGTHHGGVPYYKFSSGPTGIVRYDIFGNLIE